MPAAADESSIPLESASHPFATAIHPEYESPDRDQFPCETHTPSPRISFHPGGCDGAGRAHSSRRFHLHDSRSFARKLHCRTSPSLPRPNRRRPPRRRQGSSAIQPSTRRRKSPGIGSGAWVCPHLPTSTRASQQLRRKKAVLDIRPPQDDNLIAGHLLSGRARRLTRNGNHEAHQGSRRKPYSPELLVNLRVLRS